MPTPAQHLPVTASVLLSLCYPVLPQLQRTPRFTLPTFHSMAWSAQPSSSPQGGCWAQTPPVSTAPTPARLGCPALLAPPQSSTAEARSVGLPAPRQCLTAPSPAPHTGGCAPYTTRHARTLREDPHGVPAFMQGIASTARNTHVSLQHPRGRPAPVSAARDRKSVV